MPSERPLNHKIVALEVINDIRLLGSESAFDIFGHLDKFGEALLENLAVTKPVHELIEAPENRLLVANVEKEHGNDIVHALDVTDFIVVISVCFEYMGHIERDKHNSR